MIKNIKNEDVLKIISNSISVDKKTRIFSSNHILNDILELSFFRDQKEQKINFLILFHLSEELLNNCRAMNYNLSSFYQNRLFNIYNFEINGELKNIFSILYYPCIAYFEYCYKSSHSALIHLSKCIKFINNNNELKTIPAFKSAICEQMLNQYKCLVKMNEYQRAFIISKKLLFYIDNNFRQSQDYEAKFLYYLEEMFFKIADSNINTIEFIQTIKDELFSFTKFQYLIVDNFFIINNYPIDDIIKPKLNLIIELPDILKLLIIKKLSQAGN
ncbi:MAG: hypothetical protein Q4G16_05185 [Cruoricaptor ignavus]|nr:hypothetical protein [Cruoricaptor ignavus]